MNCDLCSIRFNSSNPVLIPITLDCEHLFCRFCLVKIFYILRACPFDKVKINTELNSPEPNSMMMKMIYDMEKLKLQEKEAI